MTHKFGMDVARKLQKRWNQRFGDLFGFRVMIERRKLDVLSFLVTHDATFNWIENWSVKLEKR